MALLGVLLIAIGTVGSIGMSRSGEITRGLYSDQLPAAVSVAKAEMFVARERLSFDRAALNVGTPAAEEPITRGALMRRMSDEAWARYSALPQDANEKQTAEAFNEKRLAMQKLLDEGYAHVRANERDKLISDANAMQVKYNELAKLGTDLDKMQFETSKAAYEDGQAVLSRFRILSFGSIGVGLVVAVLSWLSLRRKIGGPIDAALAQFDAIAAGDLRRNVEIKSKDEMGQLLSGLAQMQSKLAETVRNVRSGSESIASASKQIAAGNVDLSSRTEEQAAALQETASSMEELTSTVKQNAENARQASSLAANASEIANKGSHVVSDVVTTMGQINQSSTKIADIISIIEGIAFQTNILALNAAVEAARAGEEGRGFAVVAGEVRTLAQRSSAAAKEIKELIEASVERVKAGSALVDHAGQTMTDIIGAVQRVTDIMGEIAAASEEQSTGIEQVGRAVTQMDEVTQQNAALVEEAAAAAQSLEDQANALRTSVATFRLSNDADSAIRPAPGITGSKVTVSPRPAPRRLEPSITKRSAKAAPVAVAKTATTVTADVSGDWERF
ncbi:methyl-accepting chemotaxis sensory transducer [Caballeronia pedi]|uniref:Methyl-accepting chemotaxis sensory transducer n=1 Tax=Caballeronia pedi TaxID=1777141 RepID=A0A158DSE9_9BURK|nr:methyl-accepting chemotaxis sensory transducer [Caballeronia pedi]